MCLPYEGEVTRLRAEVDRLKAAYRQLDIHAEDCRKEALRAIQDAALQRNIAEQHRQRAEASEAREKALREALRKYAKGPWLACANENFSDATGVTRKRWAVFEDQGGESARAALSATPKPESETKV